MKKNTTIKKAVSKKPVLVDDLNHPTLKELETKLGSYLKKTIGNNKNIEHVRKNAVSLINEGEKKVKSEVRDIEALIKKHPAASILIASTIGAGIGVVTGVVAKKTVKKAIAKAKPKSPAKKK